LSNTKKYKQPQELQQSQEVHKELNKKSYNKPPKILEIYINTKERQKYQNTTKKHYQKLKTKKLPKITKKDNIKNTETTQIQKNGIKLP